jgi:peptidoglycan hydrolase-like protein with peptidoglycan-binding domain
MVNWPQPLAGAMCAGIVDGRLPCNAGARDGWNVMGFLRGFAAAWLVLVSLTLGAAMAQDQVWVQVEAQPTRTGAEERAQAYAAAFPDVGGYRLRSGWYAIVLGPYGVAEGAARLADLRRENLIPADSFIAYGRDLREPFWPVAGGLPIAGPTVPDVTTEPLLPAPPAPTAEAEPTPPPALADETPQEARASESLLERPDREALQVGLQWFGFYEGAIDGAFGPGTRNAMADWQAANGVEPTGILTTFQRATLVGNYQADQAAFGFQTVTEAEAGIEITLPMALLRFDHYEPPFVHFAPRAGSDLRLVLISQPGDQAALNGLYDILQTLEIMPPTGERSLGEQSFTITGANADVASHAYAEVSQGLVKGYMVTWSPGPPAGIDRILPVLQSTFRAVGDRVLDPGLVVMDAGTRSGLLAGLEVRRPAFSRSGFFVAADGTVLTAASAVAQCSRITIERDVDMTVALSDAASGLAVLRPVSPLSPPAVATLQTAPDRIGAEVAVAGYSYEDRLSAPVMTFGGLEASEGLNGEAGIKRLALNALPGDAGGPVLDATGAVVGLLQPAPDATARQLPADVAYATDAATIMAKLASIGITAVQATRQGALPPEDLTRAAMRMTVLVSCWQ